ncbi:BrnT family toxin [Treponema primitia]|uniref:BrnT family toxin n=1 Tax=Treponema primitia TaxID=88058 RepID=UPI00025557BC|nr:BrnT family toxin [Treponema primitia]
MAIVWDDNKNRINIQKHGIDFELAQDVFLDPDCLQRRDDDHSDEEERWQIMGMAQQVLFVVCTERGDDTLLITARKAEPKERRIYYGDRTKYPKGWKSINP